MDLLFHGISFVKIRKKYNDSFLLLKRSSNNPGTQKVTNPTVNSDEDNTNLENNSNVEELDNSSANRDNMVDQATNCKEGSEEGVGEEIDEEPIDMSFPSGGDWKKIILYLISFPIMFPLYYTLPDTKKPKSMFLGAS